VVFENVVGLEPKNYIGDNMQKVTDVYRIAQYNVACCYSMINQTDAAVDALKAALISGFDDYKYAHPLSPLPPGLGEMQSSFCLGCTKTGPLPNLLSWSHPPSRGRERRCSLGTWDGHAPHRSNPTLPTPYPPTASCMAVHLTAGRTRRRLERMQGEP